MLALASPAAAKTTVTYSVANVTAPTITCANPPYESSCAWPTTLQDGDTLAFADDGSWLVTQTTTSSSGTTTSTYPVTPSMILSVVYVIRNCNSNTGTCTPAGVISSSAPSLALSYRQLVYEGATNPNSANYLSTNSLYALVRVKVQVATNPHTGTAIVSYGTYVSDPTNPLEYPFTPSYNAGPGLPLINTCLDAACTQINATVPGTWTSPDPLKYSFQWFACSRQGNVAYLTNPKICIESATLASSTGTMSNTYTLTPTQQNQPFLLVQAGAIDKEGDVGHANSAWTPNPIFP